MTHSLASKSAPLPDSQLGAPLLGPKSGRLEPEKGSGCATGTWAASWISHGKNQVVVTIWYHLHGDFGGIHTPMMCVYIYMYLYLFIHPYIPHFQTHWHHFTSSVPGIWRSLSALRVFQQLAKELSHILVSSHCASLTHYVHNHKESITFMFPENPNSQLRCPSMCKGAPNCCGIWVNSNSMWLAEGSLISSEICIIPSWWICKDWGCQSSRMTTLSTSSSTTSKVGARRRARSICWNLWKITTQSATTDNDLQIASQQVWKEPWGCY